MTQNHANLDACSILSDIQDLDDFIYFFFQILFSYHHIICVHEVFQSMIFVIMIYELFINIRY